MIVDYADTSEGWLLLVLYGPIDYCLFISKADPEASKHGAVPIG
jgi:hypothetical protein